MFCINCGMKLPDNAKFCLQCGHSMQIDEHSDAADGNVEPMHEQNAVDVESLLHRAQDYEKIREYELAKEYYNKVLYADAKHTEAKVAIDRIQQKIDEYVYLEIVADSALMEHGVLRLKKGQLLFRSGQDKIVIYEIDRISKIRATKGYFGFIYEDKGWEITYGTSAVDAKRMVDMILEAQKGCYPEMRF